MISTLSVLYFSKPVYIHPLYSYQILNNFFSVLRHALKPYFLSIYKKLLKLVQYGFESGLKTDKILKECALTENIIRFNGAAVYIHIDRKVLIPIQNDVLFQPKRQKANYNSSTKSLSIFLGSNKVVTVLSAEIHVFKGLYCKNLVFQKNR